MARRSVQSRVTLTERVHVVDDLSDSILSLEGSYLYGELEGSLLEVRSFLLL